VPKRVITTDLPLSLLCPQPPTATQSLPASPARGGEGPEARARLGAMAMHRVQSAQSLPTSPLNGQGGGVEPGNPQGPTVRGLEGGVRVLARGVCEERG
jgi:hypothetical protein